MTINELVTMAQRIHDAEGYNLGASSTREYRNAFWARVIGCAYHGHPVYNAVPDRQWHLKNAGGGRPQSDDVAVSMPSRAYWDCIPNAGGHNYGFSAAGHAEPLPMEQEVYAPPVPSGSGGQQPGPTPIPPQPQPPGLTKAEVQAMIDATVGARLQDVAKYGDQVGLRAATGPQKVLCHENGGPPEDERPFPLTTRTNVGPWESWTLERGQG